MVEISEMVRPIFVINSTNRGVPCTPEQRVCSPREMFSGGQFFQATENRVIFVLQLHGDTSIGTIRPNLEFYCREEHMSESPGMETTMIGWTESSKKLKNI